MSSVTRRDFAAHVSGAVAGAITGSLASTSSVSAAMPQSSPSQSTPPEPPTHEPPPQDFVDHQLALLKAWYPAPHLTPEMIDGIRGGLRHNRSLAERIAQVPLTHDIPPATRFVVPLPAAE